MKREPIMPRELAEMEFNTWLEAMDIEPPGNDADGAPDRDKERVIKAISMGDAVVTENGEISYTPWREKSSYKNTLVFRERTGADLLAADAAATKKLGPVRQTYAMMSSLCGVDVATFSKLHGSDIKTCESIFSLLMA